MPRRRKTFTDILRIREHRWIYLSVSMILVLGIVFGALSVSALSVNQTADLRAFLDQFLNGLGSTSPNANALLGATIWSNLKTLLVIATLGMTIIGVPGVLVVLFTRGFILGFTVAFITAHDSGIGFGIAALGILPQNLILIPLLIIGGVYSVVMAGCLWKAFHSKRKNMLPRLFITYGTLIGILAVGVALSAIVEAYVSPALIHWLIHGSL